MTKFDKYKELIGYYSELSIAEQKALFKMLKTYLAKREQGANIQSLEDYTKELEQSDAEIEAGDFVLHEDVVKYFSKN
jgi:GTP-binding protein EngB required for normal cell division